MVEKGNAQKRGVRGSVEEWVIFKTKLDVTGQVLSPLIKIQSTNNYFINSSHSVSSPVTRLKATVLYFVSLTSALSPLTTWASKLFNTLVDYFTF